MIDLKQDQMTNEKFSEVTECSRLREQEITIIFTVDTKSPIVDKDSTVG